MEATRKLPRSRRRMIGTSAAPTTTPELHHQQQQHHAFDSYATDTDQRLSAPPCSYSRVLFRGDRSAASAEQLHENNAGAELSSSAAAGDAGDAGDAAAVELGYYEEDDNHNATSCYDDDTLSPRSSSSSSASFPTTTQTIVQVSRMQVHFCEMTVEEMNQIMAWWSSSATSSCTNPSGEDADAILHDEECRKKQQQQGTFLQDAHTHGDDATTTQNDIDFAHDQEQMLLGNSLIVCDTPSSLSPPSTPTTTATAATTGSMLMDDDFYIRMSPTSSFRSPHASLSTSPSVATPTNLIYRLDEEDDPPLPQNLSFFSPFKGATSFFFGDQTGNGNNDMHNSSTDNDEHDENELLGVDVDFGAGPPDENEINFAAREQQEQITRLLFTTRDMADQVTFLTETSGTDEDADDDLGGYKNNSDDWNNIPAALLNQPRNAKSILRRRHRKKNAAGSDKEMSIRPTASEDSTCSWMQLQWQDHGRIWLWKQVMALETTIVSRCLVPVLPLPFLLYLMHRPKAFRCLLSSIVVWLLIVLPILSWYFFPARVTAASAPLPNLQLFLQHPYYTSILHYSLQGPLPKPTTTQDSFCYYTALDVSEARNHESWRI